MTDTHTTAHIPDEAVQAAIKSFESTDNNCETYQDMRKAIACAIQKICEQIDIYDVKDKLFGEMSRRFKNEKYIWESWKDFYPNPEYLPVDDTEIGVEFAFKFLEHHLEKSAITSSLPHLSAPCAVEVRDLTWFERTLTADGRRQWQSDDKEVISETCPEWSTVQGFRLFHAMETYPTLSEAKAAAQADFERRILSCVVTKPVDVAAVPEQALEALKKAEQFIENGVEFGFIRLPDSDDPALEALPKIKEAIRALSPAEPAQGDQSGITISSLQAAHIERQKEWCPDQQPDLSFRGNEMAGEVGEACNVIKKLERERQGWRGTRSSKEELANELADVIHTAILCAVTAGIDLDAATIEKFNATSDKNDLRTRLPAAPTREAEA